MNYIMVMNSINIIKSYSPQIESVEMYQYAATCISNYILYLNSSAQITVGINIRLFNKLWIILTDDSIDYINYY